MRDVYCLTAFNIEGNRPPHIFFIDVFAVDEKFTKWVNHANMSDAALCPLWNMLHMVDPEAPTKRHDSDLELNLEHAREAYERRSSVLATFKGSQKIQVPDNFRVTEMQTICYF